MISTVNRQDADLFFNSYGINYAVEILLSFFLMGHRGEKKWPLILENLFQLHGRAEIKNKAQVLPQRALIRRFKFQNHRAEKPSLRQDYFHKDP